VPRTIGRTYELPRCAAKNGERVLGHRFWYRLGVVGDTHVDTRCGALDLSRNTDPEIEQT